MAQLEAALAIIEEWKKKCFELSSQRKDALFTASTRGFEAMAAMISKESSQEDIQHALGYLNFDTSFSLQYDKLKDDPTRDIMHGLLESLHLVFSQWAEEKKHATAIGDVSGQGDEAMAVAPSFQMEPKSDNNQIPAWDFGEEETKFNIKEEVMEDDLNINLDDPEHAMDNPDQLSSTGNDAVDPTMPPSDSVNDETPYNDEFYAVGDRNLEEEYSFDDISERTEDIVQSEMLYSMDKEEERRQSRRVSKNMKYTDYVDDSDDDYEPTMKKSRSKSTLKKDIKRRCVKGDDDWESAYKEPPKISDTAMDCPKCDYSTRSVDGWLGHLINIHSATPALAGVALRCECGHVCHSNVHRRKCDIANFTVIRKSNKMPSSDSKNGGVESNEEEENEDDLSESTKKESRDLKNSDTTMDCFECEYRTHSVHMWRYHLRVTHCTTPGLAGLVLRCECGHESQSHRHRRECTLANFTVIRIDDGPIRRIEKNKIPTTPQCVQCEMYPSTASAYIGHLRRHHKCTLRENSIYLVCACGAHFKSVSSAFIQDHNKKCDGINFTLHKLDEE